MATGAGRQSARGVAKVIEAGRFTRRGVGVGFGLEGQRRVLQCDRHPFARIQLSRNPRHLRMIPPSVRIGFELPLEVSGIEARKPWSAGPIALPLQPMTGETGIGRPGPGTAEGDDPAVLAEAIERGAVRGGASVQRRHRQTKEKGTPQHCLKPTVRRNARFHWLLLSLAIAACKPPPEDIQPMPLGDAAKGLLAIERVGCGSCHTIPGLRWPQGTIGPALNGLAERGLIAGKLPNRPDVLAAYIRNAPALVPGSAMPAMPVGEIEARDIAAYLYEKGAQ
ncbi:MAG TPA: hypothetical protein VFS87_03015 [Qipengyuania sp.]|nr:hypothetical protein [Qipengyuania sp.]